MLFVVANFSIFVRDFGEIVGRLLHPCILSSLIGYCLGSIPTAFILVKRIALTDLRSAGSGNIGSMNAFEVTNSTKVGVSVFLIDALKGTASVVIALLIWGGNLAAVGCAGIAAIIGHNYPVWLKFKGGRGLSTAAGVMLVVGWLFVVVWCSLWAGAYYVLRRHIHAANIVASILTPAVLVVAPGRWVLSTLPPYSGYGEFLSLACGICLLVILRHREPLHDIFTPSH